MEILVCVRRVPDTSENEIQLNSAGNDIERDDLVYSVNEADNYAVEEALQIVAKTGGNVTVATVGGEDDEEVLRREMAMGANHGVLLTDEAFEGSDGRGIATILKAFVQKGKYDLVLTGIQAEDGGADRRDAGSTARLSLCVAGELHRGPRWQEAEGWPGDRGWQQGDERDRSSLCALHPDRH